MTSHIFVDETKDRTYLVVAAQIHPTQLGAVRKQMNALLMPRQRRLHFTKEGDVRRRKIASTLCETGARIVIYDASAITDQAEARAACLAAVVDDAAELGAHMLVVEQDDSLIESDRRLLFHQVRKHGIDGALRYEHKRPHEEALLWIPDAVAWCWAKRGEWRPRVEPIVERVHKL